MSDQGPTVDVDAFFRRLGRVQAAWEGDAAGDQQASLANVDAMLILAGGSDEDNPYKKTTAFQTWLLGYEFPSTLMLVTKNKITFLAGSSRTKIIEPLKPRAKEQGLEMEVLTRGKDATANHEMWENVLSQMSGKTVGVFAKDSFTGKFVDEWESFLNEDKDGKSRKESFNTTDVAGIIAALVAVKEDDEALAQKMGAHATIRMLQLFTNEMASVLENEKSVKHEKLSENIEGMLEVPKTWRNFNPIPGQTFDSGLLDWCYTPIIQSGGAYDLRPSAQSDEGKLKAGIVLCSMGVRYKSYCANVGRTFLIDPEKTQKENFAYLVSLQQFVLEQMKDGVNFSEVYSATTSKIQSERPDLSTHFSKSMGFLTGIEFKESSFSLNHKCQKVLKSNMIFSLNLGFQGIQDPKNSNKDYALQMVDTVVIGPNGATLLADGLKSNDDVMFSFDDGAQEKPQANGKAAGDRRSAARSGGPTITKSKLRQKDRAADEQVEARKQHQRSLHEKKNEEGKQKYAAMSGESLSKEKLWKRFESYARETQLPDSVQSQHIVVDNRRQSVIVPINGFAVPFHIKTVRSIVKQEEGDYTTLRLMFVAPGQIQGKKEDTPFEDPNANFIRALSYRSQDNYRFSELHRQLNDLKKESVKREQEKQQMADLVDQDRLVEGRRGRLHDVWLRPAFEGKRSTGDLEIHQNGIRWASKARSEHKCDILFSNIQHLFFQPCDNELIVLVHVHLRTPIMIGKKKTKDVSFFREASESSFDETGNRKRRRQHEDDELRMEQEERRQRAALNKEFRQFADRVSDAAGGRFEVDIPFRELGFSGVPHRTNVTLMPTTDCLVHLTDQPSLVITLADIEIAHLERVQYGLRNFDLVIIFKDLTRPPTHINTIPSEDLENVKEWLNSVDIPFSEGPVNLNWGAIMKQVNEDPYAFYDEGGWGFLSTENASDNGDSDESSVESDFAPEGSEASGSEGESSFSEDLSASDSEGEDEPDESDAGSYAEEE